MVDLQFKEAFLGNSNTKEIHDRTRVVTACQIEKILEDHKVWIASIEEVRNMVSKKGYNGCAHCFPELHTD